MKSEAAEIARTIDIDEFENGKKLIRSGTLQKVGYHTSYRFLTWLRCLV